MLTLQTIIQQKADQTGKTSVCFVMELCTDTNVYIFVDTGSGKYEHLYCFYKSLITKPLHFTTTERNYTCSCFVHLKDTCCILNSCSALPYLYFCIQDCPRVSNFFSDLANTYPWSSSEVRLLICIWGRQFHQTRETLLMLKAICRNVDIFCLVL